jgi:hypothetical protein
MKRTARPSADELLTIPGVGTAVARDLRRLGIRRVADLKDQDPEALYTDLCEKTGKPVDHCMLYVFRCAVYFASRTAHDPEKLKWWNWKDCALDR